MNAPAVPFQLTQRDRSAIWAELTNIGFDRDYVSTFAATLSMSVLWRFDRHSPPQLDYTPAQALYVRDHWNHRNNAGQRIRFNDEMRALAVCLWNLAGGPGTKAERIEAMLDVILSALEQQADRLKVCWFLSQPRYTALPVNNDILDAIASAARDEQIAGFDALEFNAWLTQRWLPMHLRYFLHDAAVKQFGP